MGRFRGLHLWGEPGQRLSLLSGEDPSAILFYCANTTCASKFIQRSPNLKELVWIPLLMFDTKCWNPARTEVSSSRAWSYNWPLLRSFFFFFFYKLLLWHRSVRTWGDTFPEMTTMICSGCTRTWWGFQVHLDRVLLIKNTPPWELILIYFVPRLMNLIQMISTLEIILWISLQVRQLISEDISAATLIVWSLLCQTRPPERAACLQLSWCHFRGVLSLLSPLRGTSLRRTIWSTRPQKRTTLMPRMELCGGAWQRVMRGHWDTLWPSISR